MQKRIRYMDYLNVFACFAVVVLHSSMRVFSPTVSKSWDLSLFLQTAFVFAVPVFFMISGANLLGYRNRYDTKTFMVKRFKRTFVALLIASIVYYTASCIAPLFFGLKERSFSVLDFFQGFMSNDICSIYWFFYSVLMLYVMTPILSMLADHRKLMQYTIVIGFIVVILVPTANQYFHWGKYTSQFFNLPLFTYPVLYYLLGYYLTHHLKCDFPKWSLIAIAAASVFFGFIFGFLTNGGGVGIPDANGKSGAYDITMVGVSSTSAFFLSTSVFLFFKELEPLFQRNDKVYRFIRPLAAATIGIYAIHMLVLGQMSTWGFAGRLGVFWEMGLRPVVAYAISAVVMVVVLGIKTKVKRAIISDRENRLTVSRGDVERR